MRPDYTLDEIERFWLKVDKSAGSNACWIWNGAHNGDGYGHLKIRGRMIKSHRIVWELTHKQVLGQLRACHECDNPGCCNPRHIFPATQLENIADMDNKRRRGMPTSRLKLSYESAKEIRAIFTTGAMTITEIAKVYGVCPTTISRVIKGKRWNHD